MIFFILGLISGAFLLLSAIGIVLHFKIISTIEKIISGERAVKHIFKKPTSSIVDPGDVYSLRTVRENNKAGRDTSLDELFQDEN